MVAGGHRCGSRDDEIGEDSCCYGMERKGYRAERSSRWERLIRIGQLLAELRRFVYLGECSWIGGGSGILSDVRSRNI